MLKKRIRSYTENEYCTYEVKKGVIMQVYKPGARLNYEGAKQMIADRLFVSDKQMMPMYCDVRELLSVDKQALVYLESAEASKYLTAAAFHYDNILNKVFLQNFADFHAPPIPMKFFTCKHKALSWLELFDRMS